MYGAQVIRPRPKNSGNEDEQGSSPWLLSLDQIAATKPSQTQGWDCQFTETVNEDFICAICQLVIRDAVESECGHNFCRYCLSKWFHESSNKNKNGIKIFERSGSCPCPVDRKNLNFDSVHNAAYLRRKISSLSIFCFNGCGDTTQLIHLDQHINQQCKLQFILNQLDNYLHQINLDLYNLAYNNNSTDNNNLLSNNNNLNNSSESPEALVNDLSNIGPATIAPDSVSIASPSPNNVIINNNDSNNSVNGPGMLMNRISNELNNLPTRRLLSLCNDYNISHSSINEKHHLVSILSNYFTSCFNRNHKLYNTEYDRLMVKSVKALHDLLDNRKVSRSHCIEKKELVLLCIYSLHPQFSLPSDLEPFFNGATRTKYSTKPDDQSNRNNNNYNSTNQNNTNPRSPLNTNGPNRNNNNNNNVFVFSDGSGREVFVNFEVNNNDAHRTTTTTTRTTFTLNGRNLFDSSNPNRIINLENNPNANLNNTPNLNDNTNNRSPNNRPLSESDINMRGEGNHNNYVNNNNNSNSTSPANGPKQPSCCVIL